MNKHTEKQKKTYRKLLRAWLRGKTDKAVELQHKMLERELKFKLGKS